MPIELSTLRVGMLLDRAIYVLLPKNNRHVLLVHALQPLEESQFEKLKKYGSAYTVTGDVFSGFPKLEETVKKVRELCDSRMLAPFEKNSALREETVWLRETIFGDQLDLTPVVFIMHLAFGVPQPETLLHISDFSVESYERSLRLAAVTALISLWLGFTDTSFIAEFAQSVFCRELMTLEKIPGVTNPDFRFRYLVQIGLNFKVTNDELADVIELARWVTRRASGSTGTLGTASATSWPQNRVALKILRQFNLATEATLKTEAA